MATTLLLTSLFNNDDIYSGVYSKDDILFYEFSISRSGCTITIEDDSDDIVITNL